MKKYHQLLLILISVFSVSLLLIYRHEYNRLHYVLEVFNFFGKPNNCSFPELLNLSQTLQHDWGPQPMWVTDKNFAVYSAFLMENHNVEALIVHKKDKVAISSCYLWIENVSKPQIGKLSFSLIEDLNDNYSFYKYSCQTNTISNELYAVSFSESRNIIKELKKIMVQMPLQKKTQLITVCVIPSKEYRKQDVIEFISFHKILGINSFIIYHNNIPYKFMNLMQKLSLKLGIEIVYFPWNYPYKITDSRTIIEEDCHLRTKHTSKDVLIFNWNEFLVPKHHFTVSTLLDSYDFSSQTNRFKLKTLFFCTDENKKEGRPSFLHNVHFDESKTQELYIFRNNIVKNNIIHTQDVSSSVAAIHKYISCSQTPYTLKTESAILRFAKEIKKSVLFKLFTYNRI